tara:strand:+ start:74338 stop:75024 length:687 start_codon:yes stop_codon:yes gene_type:complete
MLISLSAKPVDVKSCAWYKFLGKRPAKFLQHHRSYDLILEAGHVFGVKPIRGGNFYLIDAEALDLKFKISQRELSALLKRSRTFTGKVDGKSVKDSLRGAPAGHDKQNKLDPSKGTKTVEVRVKDLKAPKENTGLTSRLSKVKYPGMNRIKFIKTQEMLPGEFYHFYDVSSTLRSYRRRNHLRVGEFGDWAEELEETVESSIRGIDVEVGTTRLQGEVKHLLMVVDLE